MSLEQFNLDEVRRASLECAAYHVMCSNMPTAVAAALVSVSEQELVFALRTFDLSQHARFRTHMFRRKKGWITTDRRVYLDAAVYQVVCHNKVCNNMAFVFNVPPTTLRRYVSIATGQPLRNKAADQATGQAKNKVDESQQPKKRMRDEEDENVWTDVSSEDRLDKNAAGTPLSCTDPFAVLDLDTTTGITDKHCCCIAADAHEEQTLTVPAAGMSPAETEDTCINWDSFPVLNDDAVLDGSFDDDDDDLLSAGIHHQFLVDSCCVNSDVLGQTLLH